MLAHVGYIFCTTHLKLGYQKPSGILDTASVVFTREGTRRGEKEKDKLGQISLMLMKSYSSLQDKNKIFNTLHIES
jgi:hypothetical protein